MTEGVVCDLKRFAVHDGPGVRTTLFLKGCPLHCVWCHNPESIRPQPELGLRRHRCSLCGECAKVCACHRVAAGEHRFDRAACTACGKCVETCLFDALVLYGRHMTPREAADAILEDRAFYENSGGGATVSGGEPLLQPEFCRELFMLLKAEKIHTAVDTCGSVPWSAFEAVLPLADLFLYDFKVFEPELHRRLTGRDNRLIRENLLRLGRSGRPVEIRMPLIPGVNMDDEALRRSGEFLASAGNLTAVRLLAYHSLARSKYDTVGRPDTMPQADPPDDAAMHRAAEILKMFGLRAVTSGE